jgi:hypothetical protein
VGNIGSIFFQQHHLAEAFERLLFSANTLREVGFLPAVPAMLEDMTSVILEEIADSRDCPPYLEEYLPNGPAEQWRARAIARTRELATECESINIAQSRLPMLFKNRIHLARIDALDGDHDGAVRRLLELLEQASGDEERATAQYWLWKIGAGDRAGEEALRLYRLVDHPEELHVYRKRVEELTRASLSGDAHV